MIFSLFQKKLGFGVFLVHPGIGATICIGREMPCLSYAGFFLPDYFKFLVFLFLNLDTICFFLLSVLLDKGMDIHNFVDIVILRYNH